MEIIKHYKNEVDKSVESLYQQNIITEEDVRHSEKSTELSQHSEYSESSSRFFLNSEKEADVLEINPYAVKQKPLKLEKGQKCVACKKFGKYRCPQCLKPYCSSAHFKSHNMFCSEAFYKKQVETEMKSLKSTKQEQKQVRELLKEHNQARQQDSQLNIMTEQRLMELLEIIEKCENQGREISDEMVKLTDKERQRLNQFIKSAQQGQEIDDKSENFSSDNPSSKVAFITATISDPYWTIPDGLDYYFMQLLDIQQFNTSPHLSLIIQRQNLSKKYRFQIKSLTQLIKTKPSPLVREDILQYLVIWVLVTLSWQNELNQNNDEVEFIFEQLFSKDLPKEIQQKSIKSPETGAYTLAKLKSNISEIKEIDTKNLLNTWYQASAIASTKTIVKNKYLLVETLLRELSFFQKVQQESSQKDDKKSKKRLNNAVRHVKKLEFLLSYLKNEICSRQECRDKVFSKEQDMFKHIYRTLSQEEALLIAKSQEQISFKEQKIAFQQVEKHGILIQEFKQ